MLIINADDWGRSPAETDAALHYYKDGKVTSVSSMVFMKDSERAAELASENKLDVGLHLNFSEQFTANNYSERLRGYHQRIVAFITSNKYAQVIYNPVLQREFSYSYAAQAEEFTRLFGKLPSHVDGHHHMHLCANLLFSSVIPAGTRVRRNFSFWPSEKSRLNRAYRAFVDRWLARRYRLTDYFFDLSQCIQDQKVERVVSLAKSNNVELMTHPINSQEAAYLMSDEFSELLQRLQVGSYALV